MNAAFTTRKLCGLDLRAVQVFATAADEGSFRRTADALLLSPASVSQTVRKLERHLGIRLFDRSTRSVRLTSAGREVLEAARTLLCAATELETTAHELAGTPTLRVGTLFGLGAGLAHHASKEAGSALRIRLAAYGWRDPTCGLAESVTEIALLCGPTAHDEALIRRPLAVEPRVAVVAADSLLARRRTLRLGDLDACGWARIATPDATWRRFWRLDALRGGPPAERDDAHETPESLLFAIRQGRGVWTTVPSLRKHLDLDGLRLVPVAGVGSVRIDVAQRRALSTSAIARFTEHLTSVSSELSATAEGG